MHHRTALNWAIAVVVCVGFVMLLAALGVDIAALGIGSTVALLAGLFFAEYRSSEGSRRRQRSNRRAHREESPLWQPNENEDRR